MTPTILPAIHAFPIRRHMSNTNKKKELCELSLSYSYLLARYIITVIVPIATIPKFQRVELFLLNCWTQLGMPSDIKRRVNPTNKTIGNPKAINNSIKKRILSLQF